MNKMLLENIKLLLKMIKEELVQSTWIKQFKKQNSKKPNLI